MKVEELPDHKLKRLKELESYQLVGLSGEKDFDFITSMAAQISNAKTSLISLITDEEPWFLSHYGLGLNELSKLYELCSAVKLELDEPIIIEDSRKVDFHKDFTSKAIGSSVIFFLGIPLMSSKDSPLGLLCVMDELPKQLSETQLEQLKSLAKQTENLFENRRKSIKLEILNKELEKKNELLKETQLANRIGTWEMELETGKTIWSDIVYKIHEVPKDFDHNKVNGIEFYHPEYRSKITEAITKCIADGTPMDLVCQMITAKGKLIWVRSTGRKIGDHLIGSFQDITEIKNNETRYKSVIEGTDLGTWEWNVQTGETLFNERWAEILGYSLYELSPTNIDSWIKLTHPYDLEESNRKLKSCFEKKSEFYKIEVRMKHKEGHWVWVNHRGKVFEWTEDGKPLMMYGTLQDITERKHREERLRVSEEAFRGNFESAAIGMALFDEHGKWLKVNDKVCEIFGYSQEEITELTFHEITHPEDLNEHLRLLDELIKNKRQHYQIEKRYFHKNGGIVHVLLAVSMVKDKEGKVLYFISQIIDITQKKKTEQKLKEAISNLQGILQASKQVSIIATDPTGEITMFNSGAEKLLGYKSEELVGKNNSLKISRSKEVKRKSRELSKKYNKDINGFEALVYEAKIGVPNTKEWTYVRKDGTIFPVLVSIDTILDGQNVIGYLEVATDISELKKVEMEVKSLLDITSKQNERLHNFAHIVSHNLRSHSGGISGILNLIESEYPEIAKNELVSLLINGTENLKSTVHDLTEIISVNLSKSDTSEVNIYEVVQKNLEIFSIQIKQAEFEVFNTVDKSLTVKGIPAYLDSIMLNMITNAVKYRNKKKKSYLKIYAISEKTKVTICFEDNGLGINLKMHGDKLFGLYKTFHDHDDSRGLGLFITKNQVESMNGKIEVESMENKGTTFKIILPK
jgi:PAS domain S-box-containing protein